MGGLEGLWDSDARFLLSEIDFRDMLISDLRSESSAYERGRSDAQNQLEPILRRCLKQLEKHNAEYDTVTQDAFLLELRVIIGLIENDPNKPMGLLTEKTQ